MLPQLPQEVRDLGITVRKGSTDILLIVHMFAANSGVDRKYIANYANLQVRERLLRTPGVGDVNTNAARDYAMRVGSTLIAPPRAISRSRRSSPACATTIFASRRQPVGAPPFNDNPAAYQLRDAQGRLETPEEFADAIIKRDAQGRVTRIGDVARRARRAELRDQCVHEPRACPRFPCSKRRTPTRSRPGTTSRRRWRS